jgi:HD-GYP domain-containing protein (c-di-GMP phosphodiesterase class II)
MTGGSRNGNAGKSFWRAVILLVLALLLATLFGWLASRRATERELAQVYARESLVADGRATAVTAWLDQQKALVSGLAGNPSVQIYAEAVALGDEAVAGGQRTYLGTLLQATADRAGLTGTGVLDGTAGVKANIVRVPSPGLAIISAKGDIIASIGGPLPKLGGLPGNTLAIDEIADLGGTPAIRLLAPVGTDRSAPTTYVYLVRRVDDSVAKLLIQPGEAATSGEAALVAPVKSGGGMLYLTARRGITAGSQMPGDPVARAAPDSVGKTVTVTDSDGTQYLQTSRAVKDSTWIVTRLAPSAAVVDPVLSRQRLWLWALVSGLGLAGTLVLLAWRQGVAERAIVAAEKEAELREYLSAVSDRQPTAITVLNAQGRIEFANATARRWAGSDTLEGAALASVLGEAASVAGNQGSYTTHNGAQQLLVDVAPLNPGSGQNQTLVVAQDISDLVQERARREANLTALVQTLAGLIDARDPGSQHHSEKVSVLAAHLGRELSRDDTDIETLRIAGLLMNVGKILVPREILTKAGVLTDAEKTSVADARHRTAQLLAQVPFDGAVAATIAGATDAGATDAVGVSKLSAILKLANAFVGMVSKRAHRPAMSVDEALAELRTTATPETAALVSALANWLDNRNGRAVLQAI